MIKDIIDLPIMDLSFLNCGSRDKKIIGFERSSDRTVDTEISFASLGLYLYGNHSWASSYS